MSAAVANPPSAVGSLRVVTFNVLDRSFADGDVRSRIVGRRLRALEPHIVALQEVTRNRDVDQAREWLGPDVTVLDHPNPSADGVGACLASTYPVRSQHVLDLHGRFGATGLPWVGAVAAEVCVPPPIGVVLVVHYKPSFQLDGEYMRERQAVAVAGFIDDLAAGRPDLPVILLGDFDAGPEAASIQFLTGRRSLGDISVRYEDAWEARHPGELGHTFSPENTLVRAGQMPLERGRRIDHIMVRSGDHGPLLDVADSRLLFDSPIDGVWASDHLGVLADLRPPPHPPGRWAES